MFCGSRLHTSQLCNVIIFKCDDAIKTCEPLTMPVLPLRLSFMYITQFSRHGLITKLRRPLLISQRNIFPPMCVGIIFIIESSPAMSVSISRLIRQTISPLQPSRFNSVEGPRWYRKHPENTAAARFVLQRPLWLTDGLPAPKLSLNQNSWSQFSLSLYPEDQMQDTGMLSNHGPVGGNWNSLQGEKGGSLSRIWFAPPFGPSMAHL